MAVFASVREGEACGIGEAAGCAVHDFGNECERLKGSRSQAFDQQQGGEVAKFLLVRNCEDSA